MSFEVGDCAIIANAGDPRVPEWGPQNWLDPCIGKTVRVLNIDQSGDRWYCVVESLDGTEFEGSSYSYGPRSATAIWSYNLRRAELFCAECDGPIEVTDYLCSSCRKAL
jgi:hypothetical protein